MAKIFLFLIPLLLILPLCSAVQIDMKSSYNLGETIIAKVSGNFAQAISDGDVSFYRRHMQTSMTPYILKIDNEYYIYAQIPLEKIPDNYSLVIKGAKYFQGNEVITKDLYSNFSITNKTADFSVEPGVLSSNSDFDLVIQNFQDKEISIKVSLSNKTESSGGFFSIFSSGGDSKELSSFSLLSGEIKKVNINLSSLQNGLNTIKLSSENLEYFIFANIVKENEKPNFYFEKSEINVSSSTNSTESVKVFLSNPTSEPIKNVSLSLSASLRDYANLSNDSFDELKANSLTEINLEFFSSREVNETGFLKAESSEKTRILNIYFSSYGDYFKPEENSSKTCSELSGQACAVGLVCTGTIVNASDDRCCVGVCNKPASSSYKALIGWTFLTIILLLLFWFLTTKYRGAINRIDLSLKNIRK